MYLASACCSFLLFNESSYSRCGLKLQSGDLLHTWPVRTAFLTCTCSFISWNTLACLLLLLEHQELFNKFQDTYIHKSTWLNKHSQTHKDLDSRLFSELCWFEMESSWYLVLNKKHAKYNNILQINCKSMCKHSQKRAEKIPQKSVHPSIMVYTSWAIERTMNRATFHHSANKDRDRQTHTDNLTIVTGNIPQQHKI